jgi:hypothetical protein
LHPLKFGGSLHTSPCPHITASTKLGTLELISRYLIQDVQILKAKKIKKELQSYCILIAVIENVYKVKKGGFLSLHCEPRLPPVNDRL